MIWPPATKALISGSPIRISFSAPGERPADLAIGAEMSSRNDSVSASRSTDCAAAGATATTIDSSSTSSARTGSAMAERERDIAARLRSAT